MPQSCTRLHCSAKMPVVFLILWKCSRSQWCSFTHPSPRKPYKKYRWKLADKAEFRICSLLLKNLAFFIMNKHLLFTYAFHTPLLLLPHIFSKWIIICALRNSCWWIPGSCKLYRRKMQSDDFPARHFKLKLAWIVSCSVHSPFLPSQTNNLACYYKWAWATDQLKQIWNVWDLESCAHN